MTKVLILSKSEEETKEIAERIATFLKPGDVITMSGDLGAGKTTFTKGLAIGLNIVEPITSPTFTIIKEYEGTLPLYHMDVYRMEFADEDIGYDEYFYGDGVTVVEWASFITDYLPDEYLAITIDRVTDDERSITIEAVGERYEQLIDQVKQTDVRRFFQ